ncbi:hypothetical protein CONLIGDRAFT_550013, partial [Coniochaeta ligniaria NRRL 30616]
LPPCGLTCIMDNVLVSSCRTVANTSCLCSNEDLQAVVQQCLQTRCTVLEAIDTTRVEAGMCQKPRRSRKADIFATLAVEIPAFICALLRLFSRWYTAAHFELDDYVMLVLFFIAESMYLAIITLTKISILFFYLRIFPNPGFRAACYIIMTWVSITGIVFLAMQIFQCIPIAYSWEGWKGTYGQHRCVNINTLAFTAAGISIAQDVVILALPLPLLARLQVSWRSKLEVMVMFSLGIFIVITSCIRLRSIVYFARSSNPTWDYTDALIWTGLEAAVSIIVVSLPAIRVLVTRISPKLLASIGKLRGSSLTGSHQTGSGNAYHPRS